MSNQYKQPDGEVLRPAFPDLPEATRPYTRVSYGLPYDVACRKNVDDVFKCKRVYIIASKGLATATDKVKRLEKTLGERHVGTFIGIAPHTPYEALVPIIQDMRTKDADCLVSIGGGSYADGAKTIVYALANGVNTVDDLIKIGKQFVKLSEETQAGVGNAPTTKLIFMPTTLSAAEFSKYGAAVDPESKYKVNFTHPGMFASLVIFDPDLCRTTPDWVWRSTGMRAIDHCVENICSSNADPASDEACKTALPKLMSSLLAYTRDADDVDARLESQIGSNLAMTGLAIMVMCGASHGIGHQLGPLGVGHGQTSCILLPAVCKWNAGYNQKQQDTVLDVIWNDEELVKLFKSKGLTREGNDLGDVLRAYFNELGMPKSLAEFGIKRSQWPNLEKNSLDDHFVICNPRPIRTQEDVRQILEMVAGDS